MDAQQAKAIAEHWMIPTPAGAYMAGPREPADHGAGRGYRDDRHHRQALPRFRVGPDGGRLGAQPSALRRSRDENLKTISHSTKTFLNVDRLELHKRLGEILTPPLQKTLFLVSGSDAIEAAIDLARKATGGVDVLALDMALHGSTSFVTRSLTFGWGRAKHKLAAPGTSAILTPYAYRSPLAGGNDFVEKILQTSFEIADANFTAKPAAVILEPGAERRWNHRAAGRLREGPHGDGARARHAGDHGRITDRPRQDGKMWGHLHEDVVPDIMTVSKHFGAGLPVSAVCTTPAIAQQAVDNGYFATRSHACDPIVCAAGVASIDIIQQENLVERAAAIGRRMQAAIETMARDIEEIGDIRGRGVLYGIELVENRGAKAPASDLCRAVVTQCQNDGLLVQARGSHGRMNVIRLVPPMVSTDAEIDRGMEILDRALRTCRKATAKAA
ncbi:MAG: aminotransferase class III-fold pyridoxal phosphate-dependent enzyme [Pseudomonadota bacterium]